MRLIWTACALGAIGGITEFWRPEAAHWFNIAGIALFLAGVLSWLTGGKRSARNWDADTTFTSSSVDDVPCDSGCDGGGDGGD